MADGRSPPGPTSVGWEKPHAERNPKKKSIWNVDFAKSATTLDKNNFSIDLFNLKYFIKI